MDTQDQSENAKKETVVVIEKEINSTVQTTTIQNNSVGTQNPKLINYKLVGTGISGFIIGIALAIFAYLAGPQQDIYPTTYIICISGSLIGWLIAIISTPYDKTDEDKIGKFTKLIGTFLTGYILSKFDKVIEKIVDPTQILSLTGLRILLFICCFALTFIIVFVYRQYATGQIPAD